MEISIFNPLPYYCIVFIYTLFYFLCTHLENPFIAVWIIFGLLPMADQYLSLDLLNPTKDQQKELKNLLRFQIPLLITIAFDWIFLFWSINQMLDKSHNTLYKLGILSVMVLLQGASINTSHELNHKIKKFDNFFGTFNLSKSFYMHFFIEHNQGHHRNVSTPGDPASSRLNESLYRFFPRSVIGTFFSSWNIENKNCLEKYGTAYTYKNRMFYFTAAIILMPSIFYLIYGLKGMLLQIIIGIGSFLMLETVNYIEHYGLARKKLENGEYEKVNNTHSWNAPHRLTNYVLFKLQRHSDHHENALKPYQNLCTYEDSPLLPNGYSLCILMAFYPKLWFDVMNPMVESYKNGGKPSPKLLETVNKKLQSFIWNVNYVLFAIIFLQLILNKVQSI